MGTCVASAGKEDDAPTRSPIVAKKMREKAMAGKRRSKRMEKGSRINQAANTFPSDRHRIMSRI